MKLEKLIERLSITEIIGDSNMEVAGVEMDSRKIKSGDLFVAINGTVVDGHKFIASAIEQGRSGRAHV